MPTGTATHDQLRRAIAAVFDSANRLKAARAEQAAQRAALARNVALLVTTYIATPSTELERQKAEALSVANALLAAADVEPIKTLPPPPPRRRLSLLQLALLL